jgi:flavin-binding protein dodecin
VPVVYHLGETPRLEITAAAGGATARAGDTLDEATSAAVFQRTGAVRRIDAWVRPGA